MITVPIIQLNDGTSMPAIALGTYKSLGDDVEIAVKHAIDVGYRHIDTAYVYCNEKIVGKAILDKIDEGVIKREDMYVVTKLWCTFHEKHLVEHACRKSLENLGLEYIDLYLMHAPIGYAYKGDDVLFPQTADEKMDTNEVDYLDTWKEMEKLVKLGLVKSIGVSNFNSEQIKRIMDNCVIAPVNNQVECTPNLNQKKLTNFCKRYDIVVTAYSPLGRPNFTDKTPDFMFDQKLEDIAKKYNKTKAQVVLRYLYQLDVVPLPKSVTKSRIEENFNIFDFILNRDDMKIIESFNNGKRIVNYNHVHKYNPLNIEY